MINIDDNKKSPVERLKTIRKELRLSQKEFAGEIGLAQASYSLVEKSKRTLTDRVIKAFCAVYGINEKWLLKGEEPKFINSQLTEEMLDVFSSLSEPTQRYVLVLLNTFNPCT